MTRFVVAVLVIAVVVGGGVIGYREYVKAERQALNRAISWTQDRLRQIQLDLEGSNELPSGLHILGRGFGYDRDAWGNQVNYRAATGKFFLREEANQVVYKREHYELYSSGPDGIAGTIDDVAPAYIPGHERGSIERLESQFNGALREGRKSTFDKLLDKLRR